MLSKDQHDRLNLMLSHALTGDRKAFDSAMVFGQIDPEAAQLLWKAGRALALAATPSPA